MNPLRLIPIKQSQNVFADKNLKNKICLSPFTTIMVVQKDNYREIEQFYHQAVTHQADLVEYTRLANWGSFSQDQFLDNDVFDPGHPEYTAAQHMLDRVKHLSDVFLCGGIS